MASRFNPDVLARQLSEIVGAEHVNAGEGDSASPTSSIPLSLAPSITAAPGSVEELSACVAACHAARAAVVAWGGGTQQSWGGPPAGPYVALRTTRLKRVLIYEPDDLTISVEAGITLAELADLLAANGQMLPLDTPLPARATLGGVLATAVDGPRRLGYGTARDLMIGIRVVEAGGRISKAGGMVVKNVSGFDMMKLYLGSLGSLAVIVSANFKLIPRPRAAATLLAGFPGPEAAFAFAAALRESQLSPVAVEYLEGWTDAALGLEPPAPCLIAVRAEGLPAAVERHLRDSSALAESAGAATVAPLRDAEHADLWARVNDLPQTAELAADELVLRLSCLPGDLSAALAAARANARQHDLALALSARALSGVAYLRLRGDASALASWHAAALSRTPQLAVIAAPAALGAELPRWGRELPNAELMRRIKGEFDPEHTLNPGRFVV